jgi:hypothetical protein
MAWTQADLDALDAQILAAGVVQTDSHSDKSTTFRSVDDLKKLRQMMAAQIGARPRTRYATTDKGV